MATADQPSLDLTKLCGECHANPPKYECPRCHKRICSLGCSKSHKRRSECSGKRDPTAYIKRSQLATSSGINHDFNFLTGVERVLHLADKDDPETATSHKGENRAASLQTRFDRIGVKVQRAPRGMTRQKQNQTRWQPKHKCLRWTVEWIHEDGSREIGFCRDSTSILDNYAQGSQVQARKRRKTASPGEVAAINVKEETPQPSKLDIADVRPHVKVHDDSSAENGPHLTHGHDLDEDNATEDGPPSYEVENAEQPKPSVSIQATGGDEPRLSRSKRKTRRENTHLHFYLVKPHTASRQTVVIPIKSSDNLSSNLQGQVILEFPTIQVLAFGPNELPEGFQLEREYLDHMRTNLGQMHRNIEELEEELHDLNHPDAGPQTSQTDKEGAITDDRVMESLRKDLDVVRKQLQAT